MEEYGPVQLLVVGYENGNFTGETLDVLKQLRDQDVIRLVDLLFVTKDKDGTVMSVEHSDLTGTEFAELGARVKSMLRIKRLQVELEAKTNQLAEANTQLLRVSQTDGLTQLDNRRHIEDRLNEMFEHSIRLNEPFSLVMTDIDKFKSVNDSYGHQAGDAVLKQFARILQNEAREIDRVGRYGGEEFVMLLPGTVLDAGANRYAAEQMQDRLMNWFESRIPIRKDFEVTDEELKSHDVVFVGRPEANSALAAWKDRIGLSYDGAVFSIDGSEHASETEALVMAAPNPLDSRRMSLVVAGNSALETVRAAGSMPFGDFEYAVYREGGQTGTGFKK
jgi:diguanylate cyclase (GGDEF)-like protein